ncbi:unnamed protein product [Larinioides sclopetarius]|uniref:Uncharacterized protein n=1 Tax=Larinioides sclopetarius TaxID=280406 RepID=A0AAV1Z2Q5_9ARAC
MLLRLLMIGRRYLDFFFSGHSVLASLSDRIIDKGLMRFAAIRGRLKKPRDNAEESVREDYSDKIHEEMFRNQHKGFGVCIQLNLRF